MVEDERLNEFLKMPEYRWVVEELLPAYYALDRMGSRCGDGYLFLPTSVDNLLRNLKTKRSEQELNEIIQLFPEYIERGPVEATYSTYSSKYELGKGKLRVPDTIIDQIKIKGLLLRVAKEQWEKQSQRRESEAEFTINTILGLLVLKCLSHIAEPLNDIGYVKLDLMRVSKGGHSVSACHWQPLV